MAAPANQPQPRVRYTSRPLPKHRYRPGHSTPPDRSPVTENLPDLNHARWQECEVYLFGLDLFNARFWWECHEVLEGLWHASGRHTPAGQALQAVIQCAAAHLKAADNASHVADRLHRYAVRHARLAGECNLGVDLIRMLTDTHGYLTGQGSPPAWIRLDLP